MRKETSKTRYGTQRPAKACESAGCNAAQTPPADASVAAKRRLLTLVALRLKKSGLRAPLWPLNGAFGLAACVARRCSSVAVSKRCE